MAAVLGIDVGKDSLAVALPGPSTFDAIAETLHDAGYTDEFYSLEKGVDEYVRNFLAKGSYY